MRERVKQEFEQVFGKKATHVFSAPGRTEVCGNHTDHQHGKVLAGAIDLEAVAAVRKNDSRTVHFLSEGYPMCEVDISDLTVYDEEAGTTKALLRGVAAAFANAGNKVEGFDAYVASSVLPGSGLSSSAAIEVLIGTIFNGLFDCGRTFVEVAQFGQYAENVYFKKPCGLMDELASSSGSLVYIDFNDPAVPVIERIPLDEEKFAHAICIIDSGAGHADLTDEYAAVTRELKEVCRFFGKDFLREIDEDDFYGKLAEVRAVVGDRACLRAMHVYEENKRVDKQRENLIKGDYDAFLAVENASGKSSRDNLQNITPAGRREHQEVAFALTLAEKFLGGRGAVRVHGGGFAGTIQAFVPFDMVDDFVASMDSVLGEGACHVLHIREQGGCLVESL